MQPVAETISNYIETEDNFPNFPLAELHAHLGSSISPSSLWQIAHDLGVRLPKKDYQEFVRYLTLSTERRMTLDEYLAKIYHPFLDKLSSGTYAVEQATYQIMSDAYRTKGIALVELRNNPMRHNMGAELDLDHIIMAMLRGMERALLEYKQLRAGLIFCMDRQFTLAQNKIIVEKAIKYHKRGVVGIDVAGSACEQFTLRDYKTLFEKAKRAGLKITVHSGEVPSANDMWEALEYTQPDRIGHGIHAAYDSALMRELAARNVVLEVCPMSNLATAAVENREEMKYILRRFIEYKVPFTINTDWPEIIQGGQLRTQYRMLLKQGMLTEQELRVCNHVAWQHSFVPKGGGLKAYL